MKVKVGVQIMTLLYRLAWSLSSRSWHFVFCAWAKAIAQAGVDSDALPRAAADNNANKQSEASGRIVAGRERWSTVPMSVMGFYGAAALWAVLIARGAFKPKQWPLIAGFGLVLLLFLNVRYLIEGAPAGIAFFISLYDFFDNVGLSAGEVPSAMGTCQQNACSLWGTT